MNAYDTRVERLLCSLCSRSDFKNTCQPSDRSWIWIHVWTIIVVLRSARDTNCSRHLVHLASNLAFTDGQIECLVSAVCACVKFFQKSGKLCYFGILLRMEYAQSWYFSILPHNGHLQWQRRRVPISLGLMHNLHRRRIQCVEAMNKWPCGDHSTFYSAMVRDDVLIENNKYGYVTMQNNGAIKIVNFTHAQTAETRHSFLHPWTLGTRLLVHFTRLQSAVTEIASV